MTDRNLVNSVVLLVATLTIGFFTVTTIIPTFVELRDRLNTISTVRAEAQKSPY